MIIINNRLTMKFVPKPTARYSYSSDTLAQHASNPFDDEPLVVPKQSVIFKSMQQRAKASGITMEMISNALDAGLLNIQEWKAFNLALQETYDSFTEAAGPDMNITCCKMHFESAKKKISLAHKPRKAEYGLKIRLNEFREPAIQIIEEAKSRLHEVLQPQENSKLFKTITSLNISCNEVVTAYSLEPDNPLPFALLLIFGQGNVKEQAIRMLKLNDDATRNINYLCKKAFIKILKIRQA